MLRPTDLGFNDVQSEYSVSVEVLTEMVVGENKNLERFGRSWQAR